MKIAYFDCFSGTSGDMILGAFIDAGLELKTLKKGLSSLDIGGYRLTAEKVKRASITATKFTVNIEEHVQQHHRPLKDILKIIESSRLPNKIKENSWAIFRRIGSAEAKIHGININKVEFHEIGAVDTIIDIVGTLLALEYFKIEQVYASALPAGSGTISSAHGILPVPAPATLDLITEAGAPITSYPEKAGPPAAELVTPTGAALVTSLAKFSRPNMTTTKVGYGAGGKDFSGWPNIMRIWLGETSSAENDDYLVLLETNIDDMNPQIYGYLMEKLFVAKAVDVWFTPIQMKKNRPAVMLSVLAPVYTEATLTDIILRETTTLGVRSRLINRHTAQRETIELESYLGKINVKIKRLSGNISNISPEYEDCRKLALKYNLPLLEVMRIVETEAIQKLK
ncbi:MAG: nickel pincer cofactor biosynthesis protein LarC [Dehalococcoidales bacterium]|nr:nickel pincer cofactor biosynthesis protein LarC [Dehalococcoidales bacterium]